MNPSLAEKQRFDSSHPFRTRRIASRRAYHFDYLFACDDARVAVKCLWDAQQKPNDATRRRAFNDDTDDNSASSAWSTTRGFVNE